MSQCVFLGGAAGVGKSTLCNHLEHDVIVLRKDELTARTTQALLTAIGQPKSDRESSAYLERVRPLEYHMLIEHALACVRAGINVVVEAPWLMEMTDEAWIEQMAKRVKHEGGELQLVWLICGPQVIHQRLVERDAFRDIGKLASWDKYLQGSGRWITQAPKAAHLVLDTTEKTSLQLASALREFCSL